MSRKDMPVAPAAKVLVVDDDQPTREFVVEILEDEGYVVLAARDAAQALAALVSEAFDAVLLDLRMPGIDGVDLFRLLYERGLATMPIILMTADNKAMEELVTEGVKFILFKPFDLDTLLNCLAEALQSPKQIRNQGAPLSTADAQAPAPE